MMRFFSVLLFFLILFSASTLYSQVIDKPTGELAGDTIEGSSTDTTVIYIIKKPPVTIKEKVEVERTKQKKFFYLSMGVSSFVNSNTYKAEKGYESLARALNEATRPKTGYGFIAHLYYIPKKYILGIALEVKRINEAFERPSSRERVTFPNSYTYGNAGFIVGKWLRQTKKVSYQFLVNPWLDHKLGVSGYSLAYYDETYATYIAQDVPYKKYTFSLSLRFKLLYQVNNYYIELSPYVTLAPFSMIKKNDYFFVKRNFLGVSVCLTNKLF